MHCPRPHAHRAIIRSARLPSVRASTTSLRREVQGQGVELNRHPATLYSLLGINTHNAALRALGCRGSKCNDFTNQSSGAGASCAT